jgi:hypothetical protein
MLDVFWRCLIGMALGGLLVLPSSAQASAPPNGIALSPAKLFLSGSGSGRISVTNDAAVAQDLRVSVSSYTLTEGGIVQLETGTVYRSARDWIRVSPSKLHLEPRASAVVTVSTIVPASAVAGDHTALVLVDPASRTVHQHACSGVDVRTGKLTRGVRLAGHSVIRRHARRALRVAVHNGGDVDELFVRGQAHLTLVGRHQTLASRALEVLPGTTGTLEFTLPRPVPRAFLARVTILYAAPRTEGPGIHTTPKPIVAQFRVRLR